MERGIVDMGSRPIAYEVDEVARRLELRFHEKATAQHLRRLIDEAEAVIRTQGVAKICDIEGRDASHVIINGITMTSGLMASLSTEAHFAFPFLVTEGPESAEWGEGLTEADRNVGYVLREMAVIELRLALEERIREEFDLGTVSYMSPGSIKEWPLDEQRPLFELLAPLPRRMGATLLQSGFVNPPYSTTGIFFKTREKFYNCMLCPREACPNRKAVYQG